MTTLETLETTTEAMEQDKFSTFKTKASEVLSGLMGEYRSVMLDADRKVVTIGRFLTSCRDQFKVQGLKGSVFIDWASAQSGQGKSWIYRAISVAEVHDSLPAEYQGLPSEDLAAVAKVPNAKDRVKVLAKGQSAKGQALTAVERTKLIREAADALVAQSDPEAVAAKTEAAEKRERAKVEKETTEAQRAIEADVFKFFATAKDEAAALRIATVMREGILLGVNHGKPGLLAFDAIVTAYKSGQREPKSEETPAEETSK